MQCTRTRSNTRSSTTSIGLAVVDEICICSTDSNMQSVFIVAIVDVSVTLGAVGTVTGGFMTVNTFLSYHV